MDRRARGFTLIELLTVIAIIAILAALTFAVGPRLIERARIRALHNTMNELRSALAQYYATHQTYPPAYGYMDFKAAKRYDTTSVRPEDHDLFYLKPYLAYLKLHGVEDYYDNFSEGYDTDGDNNIGLFEFQPVGVQDAATKRYTFPDQIRFMGDEGAHSAEIGRMAEAKRRPIIYVPVNKRQAEKARKYWINRGATQNPLDFYGLSWDPDAPELQGVTFPPPTYDTFVLISVGPARSSFGIIPPAATTNSDWDQATRNIIEAYPDDAYHILGLRAYYLATRDLDGNDRKDFHYEDRRLGEDKDGLPYQIVVNNTTVTVPLGNLMPDRRAPNGYGPYVYSY